MSIGMIADIVIDGTEVIWAVFTTSIYCWERLKAKKAGETCPSLVREQLKTASWEAFFTLFPGVGWLPVHSDTSIIATVILLPIAGLFEWNSVKAFRRAMAALSQPQEQSPAVAANAVGEQ